MKDKIRWYKRQFVKNCVKIGIMSMMTLGIIGFDQSRIKEVRIGNHFIGYAKSEQVVQECFEEAKKVVNENNENRIQWDIHCDLIKGTRDDILTPSELQDKMEQELEKVKDTQKQLFYQIKVGDYVGTVEEKKDVEKILEQVQSNYSHIENVSVELVKENTNMFVPKVEVIKKSEKNQHIVASTSRKIDEKIRKTKKVSDIPKEELGIQKEEVINVDFAQEIQVEPVYVLPSEVEQADEIIMDMTKDAVVDVIVQKEEVEYKTYSPKAIYVDSDKLYQGDKKVIRKGKVGVVSITNFVEYKNGEEEKRELVKKEILKKAVPTKIMVGTKERPTFIMPLEGGRFTSPFGSRWGRLHAGVDWACPVGTEVKASSDGTVIQAGWMNGYGNCVTISHADGMATRYGHMSEVKVAVGQQVTQGDLVGLSGNTGRSTGPHLHFEIHKNGVATDPLPYLP